METIRNQVVGKTMNPAFKAEGFEDYEQLSSTSGSMTLDGTLVLSLLLVMVVAAVAWGSEKVISSASSPNLAITFLVIGVVDGIVLGILAMAKKEWAALIAPLFAACEGLFFGSLASILEDIWPGLFRLTLVLSLSSLFILLLLVRSEKQDAKKNLAVGVTAVFSGMAITYLFGNISFLGGLMIPIPHEVGWIGTAIALIVSGAIVTFVLVDIERVRECAEMGLPKFMEWYCGFGIVMEMAWVVVAPFHAVWKFARARAAEARMSS